MTDAILSATKLISFPAQGIKIIHKFGRNSSVGASFVPVAVGGVYRTPQASAATTLRIKSGGNANDTAAGSGARKIKIYGLNAAGEEVEESIVTAGASASSNTVNSYTRLFRAYVEDSGTYATQSAGSHSGDIVIEDSAGSEDWATIDAFDFARSQTEIGAYTVPTGLTAYVLSMHISVASNKTADVIFFKREGGLDAAAPYAAMRLVQEFGAISGEESIQPKTPLGPYPENTDIGFLAKAATSAEVDVDFEILLAGSGYFGTRFGDVIQ